MGQKYQTDVISPSRHTQKSSQHVRACATVDGAICSKNRKIVPYHGDSPNSRISARLRSPSPIMAPAKTCDDPISAIVLRRELRQLTPQPSSLAYKFPILEEYFMHLSLLMPYFEQRVRFENICFKVILFSAEN